MTEKILREVVEKYAAEARQQFGKKLQGVILYGSCARGDFSSDSDIDILVLLDVPVEELSRARKQMLDVADQLDLAYNVVLSPVFQSYEVYQKFTPISAFYQNVEKEGVRIA